MPQQPAIMLYTVGDYWTSYVDECVEMQCDFTYKISGTKMYFVYVGIKPHTLMSHELMEPDSRTCFGNVGFGRKHCIILPPHGDMACFCHPCTLSRLVTKLEKLGYELSRCDDLSDHDLSEDDLSDNDGMTF
jgi:hypothetical protein